MHVPSYFRPYHLEYAAPKESTFERQSHANGRFKEKNRSRAQVNKKVVKQVYCVKKDGRKDKSLVLDSNNEKPINVLETSTISEKMKQLGINNLDVKSGQKKLKVPKVKDELLQFTRESQPRFLLGLSQKDMYTQHPYFPMEQTYWGCPFNMPMAYPSGFPENAHHLHHGWQPAGQLFGQQVHKKRSLLKQQGNGWFSNQGYRPRDTIFVHGGEEIPVSEAFCSDSDSVFRNSGMSNPIMGARRVSLRCDTDHEAFDATVGPFRHYAGRLI
jgi:hypothetical protein